MADEELVRMRLISGGILVEYPSGDSTTNHDPNGDAGLRTLVAKSVRGGRRKVDGIPCPKVESLESHLNPKTARHNVAIFMALMTHEVLGRAGFTPRLVGDVQEINHRVIGR